MRFFAATRSAYHLGNNFDGDLCEYNIDIGSSFRCPMINKTIDRLTCRISNDSMIAAYFQQVVRVSRVRQGYLTSDYELRFRFQPSIFSITPSIGSISGGTLVTIEGDGFIPGQTLIFIGNINCTASATINSSCITFTTPSQGLAIDTDLNIAVWVNRYQAVCLADPCHYRWSTEVTAGLTSVTPSIINGPTNLAFTGENLPDDTAMNSTHVTINGSICMITAMTNTSIDCYIENVEVGVHPVIGFIDGLSVFFAFDSFYLICLGIGNIESTLTIIGGSSLFNVSHRTSGIYGGAILTIIGYGFSRNPNNTIVQIGSSICPIIQTTMTEIQCRIPPQENNTDLVNIILRSNNVLFPSTFTLNYSLARTPFIDTVTLISSVNSGILQINGSHFNDGSVSVRVGNSFCSVISSSATSITCAISASLPAGYHPVLVNVDTMGDSNTNVSYTHELIVSSITPTEGGYGGGLEVTIFGRGFNTSNISVSICDEICTSVTILSNDELTCQTPSLPLNSTDALCNVTVTVEDFSENTLFTYRSSLTAEITSIDPSRGGTGGGTRVTINGANFP